MIDKLNACKDVKPSLKTALKLVDDCTPSLMSIKKIMGKTAPYYLKLSSSVANCALGMVITVVNDSQKNDNDRKKLKVVEEAEKVMDAIGKLDMSLDGKQHFNQNKNTLDSIKTTLRIYKRTVWNELSKSPVFWFFVFLIGIGVVGGIIDLIAEGEFWPGFGIGCGLGLISIFNGKYGRKRRR